MDVFTMDHGNDMQYGIVKYKKEEKLTVSLRARVTIKR